MKKLSLSVFFFAVSLLFGVFFLSDKVLAQQKITCEEWMRIAVSDKCKYYNLKTKEKNQIKDLQVYCFTEPAIITDRGSSHGFEIKSRPPDYIAAFEWDKCGVGGGSGGNKSKSPANSKASPDSLSCKKIFDSLTTDNPGSFWMLWPHFPNNTQGEQLEREDGSYCRYEVNQNAWEDEVKITYFDAPPEKIPAEEDKNFEVITSDGRNYSGLKAVLERIDDDIEGNYEYRVIPSNFVKSVTIFGNCIVESRRLFTENDISALNSQDEYREYLKTNLESLKEGQEELMNTKDVKDICSGSGGITSSSNPISQFFSKLFNFIVNIFKPASKNTLGVSTSNQGDQSQQLLTFAVIGAIVGLLVWQLKRKRSPSKKYSKRRKKR